jgi:hypothetical protein
VKTYATSANAWIAHT